MLFWRGVFLLLKALNSGALPKQTQRSLNWPDKEFCWMCFFEETQQRKPEVVKFSSFVILAVFAQPSWRGYQDYITPNKLILSVPSDFSFTPAQQISIKIFKNFKVVLPETVYSAVTFSVAKVLVSAAEYWDTSRTEEGFSPEQLEGDLLVRNPGAVEEKQRSSGGVRYSVAE